MLADGEHGPLFSLAKRASSSDFEIAVNVPKEATSVNVGFSFTGPISLKIEKLQIKPTTQTKRRATIQLAKVNTYDDAYVTVLQRGALTAAAHGHAKGGQFSFELADGDHQVFVTSPTQGFAEGELLEGQTNAVLTPTQEGASRLKVDVVSTKGTLLRGRTLRATTNEKGFPKRAIYTVADDSGSATLWLPKGRFAVGLLSPTELSSEHWLSMHRNHEIRIVGHQRDELAQLPSKAVVNWIMKSVVDLPGAQVPLPRATLGMIGEAKVIGLGEGTHGTRDFAQAKLQILKSLVVDYGFNFFAVEGNFSESLAVNRYVLHGKGEPIRAISGMHFNMHMTETFLELVEWMKQHNEGVDESAKVQFIGIDMQYSAEPIAALRRYFESAALSLTDFNALEELADDDRAWGYRDLSADVQTKTRTAIARLQATMDSERAALEKQLGRRAWLMARQHLQVLTQCETILALPIGDGTFHRDRFMADNIEWLAQTFDKKSRIAVWAHNLHVANGPWLGFPSLGEFLKKSLGTKYLAVGFLFNRGTFSSIDWSMTQDFSLGRRDISVGLAPPNTLEASFATAKVRRGLLDLRKVPGNGPVHDWFNGSRYYRFASAIALSELHMRAPLVPTHEYDILAYFHDTRTIRPIKE